MKKVAILHENLEWTEKKLEEILQEKHKCQVKRFDIRSITQEEILEFKPEILLNRVYASVGNRNYDALDKTLTILEKLESKGVQCVNNLKASKVDYSKMRGFIEMENCGINTPYTIPYDGTIPIKELGGFPIIVKRDRGGRGIDVTKCSSEEEVMNCITKIRSDENYKGNIILQEFALPIEPRDYRVCVINGEVIYHHGRSLISIDEGEIPWMASRSLGSTILPIERGIPKELADFAIKATEAIGAAFNVLDIIKTDKGYCVIENNPTPNFRPEYEDILGFCPIKYVVRSIIP